MMTDDYLWDRTGEPDPEIRRLEEALRPLRHDRPAPSFPEMPRTGTRRRRWRHLAAAAALVLAVTGTLLFARLRGPAWDVTALSGAPQIGGSSFVDAARLRVGAWLETDAGARARVEVGRIGAVDVDPGSRVRLLDADPAHHRLRLERGRLRAKVWAPPRLFAIETPGALAVDLGCVYTLEVDERGSSLLRVEGGWVAFEWQGGEAFVPAGASCRSGKGDGPGTPYFDDASEGFRQALACLDPDSRARTPVDPATLATLLGEARRRDALTLWHLLAHLDADGRARTFDRLAALVPLPPRVTRAGVIAGDRAMLDALWPALGLGDVELASLRRPPT